MTRPQLENLKYDIAWLINSCNDSIVLQNVESLLKRSIKWVSKYGVTLDRDDLSEIQRTQHALEEALDLSNYLQKLISLKNLWS